MSFEGLGQIDGFDTLGICNNLSILDFVHILFLLHYIITSFFINWAGQSAAQIVKGLLTKNTTILGIRQPVRYHIFGNIFLKKR